MLSLFFYIRGWYTSSGWRILSDNPQCEPYTPNRDFPKKANTPQYIYESKTKISHFYLKKILIVEDDESIHNVIEELAEKINVSRQTIFNWENGRFYPDIDALVK